MDRWGASNLDKSWQKWRMSSSKGKRTEERKEKTEKGELGLGLDEALYIVISLVPVGDTNRD